MENSNFLRSGENLAQQTKKVFFDDRKKWFSILSLVILVLGIPLALWLLQKTQILAPRADIKPIELISGGDSCVVSNDPNKVTCASFPIKLTSPLGPPVETGNSCNVDTDCSAGNKCFKHQNYPGSCKSSDTVCAQVITRACHERSTCNESGACTDVGPECVDFPTPCHVPLGWTTPGTRSPSPSTETPPPTPTTLIATSNAINYSGGSCTAGRAEVGLSWAITPRAVSYKVYRVYYGQGGFTSIGNANESNYRDIVVEKGKVAYYRVTAVNPAGESSPSNEIQVDVASCPLVACQPRPDIVRATTMDTDGFAVSLDPGTNINTPNNPITEVRFTALDNATVSLGGIQTQPFTSPVTGGKVAFVIRQKVKGQATNVSLVAKDTCGDYPLFFGAGASSWP